MAPEAAGTVLLTHPVGLHARPSVKFTQLARSFAAAVALAPDAAGPWIDAKSIVRVMAAKLPQHATLHIRASGADAAEAVAALVALVRDDFPDAAAGPERDDGGPA